VSDEPLTAHIKRLRDETNRLRDERKKLTRALKNAERKKTRLRHKARELSESDLLAVLQLRNLDKEYSRHAKRRAGPLSPPPRPRAVRRALRHRLRSAGASPMRSSKTPQESKARCTPSL